jgi:hypothetical protein
MLTDENAFGLLVSWGGIEDEEYTLESADFAERAREFSERVVGQLKARPPAEKLRASSLGHALYVEIAEGDERVDLLAWLRGLRAELEEHGYITIGVVTYGGRWLDDARALDEPVVERFTAGTITHLSLPSEPLRYALALDAVAQLEDGDESAWGQGLYVSNDAVEALGKKFKNAPTPLDVGGTTFFRVSR